jgi:hypothetical protein
MDNDAVGFVLKTGAEKSLDYNDRCAGVSS